jgi:DNA-binding MarR family transcriptional regulator
MCASFRRAARVITQRYDEALKPRGLTITQFTILQALSIAGEISQGTLGEILAMDSTTLTRTLGIMNKRGWVTRRSGTDRRERRLRLSKPGETEFKHAVPHWQKAQTKLRARFGQERWNSLMKLIDEATAVVAE